MLIVVRCRRRLLRFLTLNSFLQHTIKKTFVTKFLTNGLFGRGRIWNGKAFRDGKKGVNRFHAKQDIDRTEWQHEFDYTLEKSGIGASKSPSISLSYSKYQFPLSLWHSMTDVLRCVPVGDGDDVQVLIGFGSMAWSGGKLNASPFCLWRVQESYEMKN